MQNLRFKVKCAKCNTSMDFDDKDFNFKGNFDNYYICPKCGCGAILIIRFNKVFAIDYYCEEQDFEMHITDSAKLKQYVDDKLQGSEFN